MPEPVLKITTLWSGEILPDETSDFSAAKHAAPSGATKSPSLEATSAATRIISVVVNCNGAAIRLAKNFRESQKIAYRFWNT